MSFVRDFSARRNFPGEKGNPFDIFLHQIEKLEKIPGLLFALTLLIIANLVAWGNWSLGMTLWAFFLTDWALLAMLPRLGKSFGPPKPPVMIMAVARSFAGLLPAPANLILQGCGTLLVIYGYYVEPFRVKVIHQRIKTEKLSSTTLLRILHIGDLHVERITHRELGLVKLINQLTPDVILFSGDVLNLSYIDDAHSRKDAREIISQWKAEMGVYIVSGSPAVDTSDVFPELINNLPLCWLQDEKITLSLQNGDAIDIYGITCTHRPHLDRERLEMLFRKNRNNFSILLYHSPDLAPEASKAGIDLQLSGHTHGGQVRLPFYGALITGSLYGKKFEAGEMHLGGMTLNVTRGIGMEGCGAPRVRFLCPPEIHLFELSGH